MGSGYGAACVMGRQLAELVLIDDGTSFTIDDVADGIVAKLVRPYPHVFADLAVSGADEVKRNWGEIKPEERS